MLFESVTEANLVRHCSALRQREDFFAKILEDFGPPPLWKRSEDFSSLVQIILEQQVSLASARAAFDRFKMLYGDISPENLLSLSDVDLRSAYFSRQKIVYSRELAQAIISGDLNLEDLRDIPDDEVRDRLTRIKGIGRWTADIYLLMVLSRPDVMPVGDIALYSAYRQLTGLKSRPQREEFAAIAEKWAPHRSTAARLLWHFYLSSRSVKKRKAE